MADWTPGEVAATLKTYFAMLEMDLLDKSFNKTAMNKELASQLDGRSHKAVEFKHQNISWVLNQSGWPYVRGYKPASHIQTSLIDAVAKYLLARPDLEALVRAAVFPAAVKSYSVDLPPKLVEPPSVTPTAFKWSPVEAGIKRDYLRAPESNRSLGLAGEHMILEFEKYRLQSEPQLVAQIEHTSAMLGDGLGFDIRSFELDGSSRYIEVKTTRYSELTPFYFSAGELAASQHYGSEYHLYRIFNFSRKPGLFMLGGPLDQSTHMTPVDYSAVPAPPPNSGF